MTVDEIKQAVDAGQTVHWATGAYEVKKDRANGYYILCTVNQNVIGLTHRDEITLNGKEEDFYVS